MSKKNYKSPGLAHLARNFLSRLFRVDGLWVRKNAEKVAIISRQKRKKNIKIPKKIAKIMG